MRFRIDIYDKNDTLLNWHYVNSEWAYSGLFDEVTELYQVPDSDLVREKLPRRFDKAWKRGLIISPFNKPYWKRAGFDKLEYKLYDSKANVLATIIAEKWC